MRRTILFAPTATRSSLRLIGLLVAAILVVLPSMPWGAWAASPPLPVAPLWAAYGWAADGEDGWRAPVTLTLLGLLQDQLSGGPLGFYALIFLLAYFIGGVAANAMRTANLISPWMGFAATALGASICATIIAHFVLGGTGGIMTFLQAALITALLFPFVRPLYMSKGMTMAGART